MEGIIPSSTTLEYFSSSSFSTWFLSLFVGAILYFSDSAILPIRYNSTMSLFQNQNQIQITSLFLCIHQSSHIRPDSVQAPSPTLTTLHHSLYNLHHSPLHRPPRSTTSGTTNPAAPGPSAVMEPVGSSPTGSAAAWTHSSGCRGGSQDGPSTHP